MNAEMVAVFNRIIDEGDDWEKDVLFDLAVRAGVAWRCDNREGDGRECGWIGIDDYPFCGSCGRPRPEAGA